MKAKKTIYPVCVLAHSQSKKNSTIFHGVNNDIIIEAPQEIVSMVLQLSRGELTFDEIVKSLCIKWDKTTVVNFLEHLIDVGVLMDVRDEPIYYSRRIKSIIRPDLLILGDEQIRENLKENHKRIIESSMGGLRYRYETNDNNRLKELLMKRKSHRGFKGTIPIETLVKILWLSYGIKHKDDSRSVINRTVPSAGGLFPIKINLVITTQVEQLKVGVYEIIYSETLTVEFNKLDIQIDEVISLIEDPFLLKGAHAILILSSNTKILSKKYGNRGIGFQMLEAGMICQNLHLAATEHELSSINVGAFDALMLDKVLHENEQTTLAMMLLGKADNNQLYQESRDIAKYTFDKKIEEYTIPFYFVASSLKKSYKTEWSSGKDESYEVAFQKSISELIEWNSCDTINDGIKSKYVNDGRFIHPNMIRKLLPKQYELNNLSKFENSKEYNWENFKSLITGQYKYIVADYVIYPFNPEYKKLGHGNSSGCASHYDINSAISHAICELIERDAFMITWANRNSNIETISTNSLPQDINQRINKMQLFGVDVVVKIVKYDLLPVVIISVIDKNLPFYSCATACALKLENALRSALLEAESSFVFYLKDYRDGELLEKASKLEPKMVMGPHDHEMIYHNHSYITKANFLYDINKTISWKKAIKKYEENECDNLVELVKQRSFDILYRELPHNKFTNGVIDGRKTVQIVIPGLVPITFAHMCQAFGLPRVYRAPVNAGYRLCQITEDELNLFPHPFN